MKRSRETEIKRLRWRCRRGMKELDMLLENYLSKSAPDISEEDLKLFSRLLDANDPQLYDWFTGRTRPKEEILHELVKTIGGP